MLCLHDMQLALLGGSIARWLLCHCPAAQLRARVMLCAWVTGAAVAALAGLALRSVELYRNLQIVVGVAAGHGARQHLPGSPQLQAGARCGNGCGSVRRPAPCASRRVSVRESALCMQAQ